MSPSPVKCFPPPTQDPWATASHSEAYSGWNLGSLSNGLLWTRVPGPVLGLQRESGHCWCFWVPQISTFISLWCLQAATTRLAYRPRCCKNLQQRITGEQLKWGGRVSSHLSETLSIMAAEPLYSLEESGPREFPSLQPPSCPIIWRALCIYIFPFLEPLSISLLSDDALPCGPQAQASLIPSGISCIPFCLCIALFSLP